MHRLFFTTFLIFGINYSLQAQTQQTQPKNHSTNYARQSRLQRNVPTRESLTGNAIINRCSQDPSLLFCNPEVRQRMQKQWVEVEENNGFQSDRNYRKRKYDNRI